MSSSIGKFPTSRIPYPERRHLEVWPNGARLAVLVYTAPEEWCWDQDEVMDPPATARYGRSRISLSTRSAVDYGFTVGIHRIAEVFDEFDMKTTLWTNGNAVEQHRDVLETLVAAGHEIGGHGYSEGMPMTAMSREDQRESIRLSVERITELTGKPPAGWVGPGAAADEDTIELLAEAGFDYHGDLQDDELPYFLHVGGRTLVEIPYRMIGNLNDLPLQTAMRGSPKGVTPAFEHLRDAFDAYYAAAATHPLIINFGTHPHISGRPDGNMVLRRIMEHVHSHDDVWVCTYGEVAAWWRERFGSAVPAGGGALDLSAIA